MPRGRPYPAAAGGKETAPRRRQGVGAPPELEPSPPPASLTTLGAAPRQRQPQAQGQAERRPGQHRATGRGALGLRSQLARSGTAGRAAAQAGPDPAPGRPRPRGPAPGAHSPRVLRRTDSGRREARARRDPGGLRHAALTGMRPRHARVGVHRHRYCSFLSGLGGFGVRTVSCPQPGAEQGAIELDHPQAHRP